MEVRVSQDLWLGASKNSDIEILEVKLNIIHYSYLPLEMGDRSGINNKVAALLD